MDYIDYMGLLYLVGFGSFLYLLRKAYLYDIESLPWIIPHDDPKELRKFISIKEKEKEIYIHESSWSYQSNLSLFANKFDKVINGLEKVEPLIAKSVDDFLDTNENIFVLYIRNGDWVRIISIYIEPEEERYELYHAYFRLLFGAETEEQLDKEIAEIMEKEYDTESDVLIDNQKMKND